jgi:DNA ligase-1
LIRPRGRYGGGVPWDVQFRNGLYLPQIDWWLDAHHPVARSFVSHAHFDHLAPHREVLLTPGTAALMRARMPDHAGVRVERELPFHESVPLSPDHPDVSVSLHPAGHIHGSAMITLDHPDYGRLLYTGDFKLRPGVSAEHCEPPHADLVIMETTYGRPHYTFPPTETVLAGVIAFCRAAIEDGTTPVLFGYSLGKSQEILCSLAASSLPVMLHPQTLKLTQVYESLGIVFPPYFAFEAKSSAGHVVLCPPQAANSPFVRKIPNRRTAALTGWALDPGARFRYQCDAVFPLSDHADYTDLLRFVEITKPTRVLTLHGFSADFARDLRERGLDAWAINQPNQLEIPLSSPTPGQIPPGNCNQPGYTLPESSSAIEAHEGEIGFAAFSAVAERVAAEASKHQKIACLQMYLATLPPADQSSAALFFTGRAFPQSDSRSLNVGWALLRRAVSQMCGRNEAEFRAAHRRIGDGGETAEALLAGSLRKIHNAANYTLADAAGLFSTLAHTAAPTEKLDLLLEAFGRLSPRSVKYLIKIITGDLRIGLRDGLVEEAIAASTGQSIAAIREANLLCGDIAAVVLAAGTGTLNTISLRVFHPLQCMLASPEPTSDAILKRLGAPVWLEEKYDGIRCQLHKRGDRVELYSRDLNRMSDQFPDLARAVARELPADCILDGELLAWRDGRALPFAELQKRLNRRLDGDDLFLGDEIPLVFSAFDLLWLDGKPLQNAPLRTRRSELESMLALPGPQTAPRRAVRLAPVTWARDATEIEAAFLIARHRGNEGLMAKDPASVYTPGRRGLAWLKLKKAYATLDVVVVAAELGHGKRRGVLSDYTFAVRDGLSGELRTLGKAYSGLTDAEIAELTEHFLANTIEQRGRLRLVVPDTVLEIAFDRIQPSTRHDSGLALRFPRIARIRRDKTPREIDTLETCLRLAEASALSGAEPAQ